MRAQAQGQTASDLATPDFRQAEAMLELLGACHMDHTSAATVEHVLALRGTGLVVQQQNISRRVTMQQYQEVLKAACSGKVADVKPAEPGARGDKGVTGLTQDVAPSLIWGRDNIPLLEARLAELRRHQSMGNAIPLARKYLPQQDSAESLRLSPRFYVVMGGRAGAAAIDDQLYFDVLISAWRESRGTARPMTAAAVVEFFAHETHHLGFGQILDQKRNSLHLTAGEDQAWRFLVAAMMEGHCDVAHRRPRASGES